MDRTNFDGKKGDAFKNQLHGIKIANRIPQIKTDSQRCQKSSKITKYSLHYI